MNHRIHLLLVAALVSLFVQFQSRAADPVEILLDPHAGSADKFDAVTQIARTAKITTETAPALARQSKYDQPHIRALALQTLVRLVGEKEAERLRDQVTRDDAVVAADFLGKWLDSAKTWEEMPRAAFFFHEARPEFQRAAVFAALRIWDKTHQPPPKSMGFDEWARRDFLAVLSNLTPSLSPRDMRSAAELVRAMSVDDGEAVPLLLAALASENAGIRALAAESAARVFIPDAKDTQMFKKIVSGIVQSLVQPEPSVRLTITAMDRLAAMGPAAREIAVYVALRHVMQGNSRARPLLECWGQDQTPLAKAVIAISPDAKPFDRTQLSFFLEGLTIAPTEARDRAIQLLSADGEPLRDNAAALIGVTDPTRVDRYAVLNGIIMLGNSPSPRVLKLLNIDPDVITPRLVQWLKSQQSPVRQAALNVLKITRLQGGQIRPALEPLLEDPDDNIRAAAATLLDRKDVLARMRVPAILRDLRSDIIDRRMIAARQLDDLGIEPKEVTAALRRAVDRRDMPAREGLIAALEAAHASHQKTLEVLQRMADESDAAPRAYARAALREIASVK
ncbi:MAG: hypothetical protein JWN40_1910 [Phycisphaerales bacterium]|nr:hypothetical protein [Phycisphaerales bacterium]